MHLCVWFQKSQLLCFVYIIVKFPYLTMLYNFRKKRSNLGEVVLITFIKCLFFWTEYKAKKMLTYCPKIALIFHVPFRIQNTNFKFYNKYQWHPILLYYFKVIAIQYIYNPIWIYIPTLYLLHERFISKVELPI